jgi:predicted Zn-dependent protease
MEGTMGDEEHDKSIIEKTVETVKDIATKASDAAKKALGPERPKPGEDVVFLPAAGDGLADPLMPSALMMPVVVKNPSRQEEGPSKESCCDESGQKVVEEVCNEKESRESVETRSRTEGCCEE